MYEIKENRRVLPDGTEITTYSRDIVSANILEVEAGTTGYKGGDSGHGGRTYFRIADAASTDIQVHTIGRYAYEGFDVFLGGDCEPGLLEDAPPLVENGVWQAEFKLASGNAFPRPGTGNHALRSLGIRVDKAACPQFRSAKPPRDRQDHL